TRRSSKKRLSHTEEGIDGSLSSATRSQKGPSLPKARTTLPLQRWRKHFAACLFGDGQLRPDCFPAVSVVGDAASGCEMSNDRESVRGGGRLSHLGVVVMHTDVEVAVGEGDRDVDGGAPIEDCVRDQFPDDDVDVSGDLLRQPQARGDVVARGS